MFEADPLHQRGKALEDEFFHRVDEELRAKLRESMEHERAAEVLAAATGFQDRALLEHLIDAGFAPATVAALALIPIVFVAWADGKVAPQERQIVLGEALKRGLDRDPTTFHLVESWLHAPPPKSLWTLWKEYTAEVNRKLSPTRADQLVKEILQQARAVAEASGGTFGFGKVSKEEQAVLDDISNTLEQVT